MTAEQQKTTAAQKQFLPVRDLIVFGTIIVSLGLCSLFYSSRSSTPEVYQLIAAALVVVGLGKWAKIPRQRRVIHEAKRRAEQEQA